MQIICISSGSYSRGKDLAEALARKMGSPCYGREDLVEAAIQSGIAVGKLETAMLKPRGFNERLTLEKEHYQAFATAFLCEKALESNFVYHGRTGHLLLPNISHVLRLRVEESIESRIEAVVTRMNVSWEKARTLVEEVDEDVRRWVRTFYNADWDAIALYDMIINLEQMSVTNTAASLCTIAALPDFQDTPASRKIMEDLYLAAKVRIALARDDRTYNSTFRVAAEDGEVLVTYLPSDGGIADSIPEVAQQVEGIRELRWTMAETNILWIQEAFDPTKETYDQIVELARRWNAAVELFRFLPADDNEPAPKEGEAQAAEVTSAEAGRSKREYNGGIEDDVPGMIVSNDGGLHKTQDSLAQDGVAGSIRSACCQANRLLDRLDSRVRYSLVVIGDVFLSRGHAAQVRMSRELAGAVTESLKVPVVSPEEMKKTYLFSPALLVRMLAYLAVAAGAFALIFSNQGNVLSFLSAEGAHAKILAAVAVAIFVPLFAFFYGTFTKNVLKLLRIE